MILLLILYSDDSFDLFGAVCALTVVGNEARGTCALASGLSILLEKNLMYYVFMKCGNRG